MHPEAHKYLKLYAGRTVSHYVVQTINWFLASRNTEMPCDTTERPPWDDTQRHRYEFNLSDEAMEFLSALASKKKKGKTVCSGIEWLIWQHQKYYAADFFEEYSPHDYCKVCFDINHNGCQVCNKCTKKYRCAHGRHPHECNTCMMESDFAFNSYRESYRVR